MRYIGSTITSSRNTTPIITTWFYFLIKKEGSAMPTLKDPIPSGLPYFRHFYLAY